MKKRMFLVLSAGLLLGLAGCGAGKTGGMKKQEIVSKGNQCKNKKELRAALGEPVSDSQTAQMGQVVSVWTYKGSDGEVVFDIGDGDGDTWIKARP